MKSFNYTIIRLLTAIAGIAALSCIESCDKKGKDPFVGILNSKAMITAVDVKFN